MAANLVEIKDPESWNVSCWGLLLLIEPPFAGGGSTDTPRPAAGSFRGDLKGLERAAAASIRLRLVAGVDGPISSWSVLSCLEVANQYVRLVSDKGRLRSRAANSQIIHHRPYSCRRSLAQTGVVDDRLFLQLFIQSVRFSGRFHQQPTGQIQDPL